MNNKTHTGKDSASDTLIEFPCEFPLKIMGNNHANFVAMMCELVGSHLEHDIDASKITQRPSSSGKYLAVTMTFTAVSKQQVDKIYRALYEHADVKMTL